MGVPDVGKWLLQHMGELTPALCSHQSMKKIPNPIH